MSIHHATLLHPWLKKSGIIPSEARTVMDLAEGVHKTLALAELEQRFTALEEQARLINR